jgi:hypothetical protein
VWEDQVVVLEGFRLQEASADLQDSQALLVVSLGGEDRQAEHLLASRLQVAHQASEDHRAFKDLQVPVVDSLRQAMVAGGRW